MPVRGDPLPRDQVIVAVRRSVLPIRAQPDHDVVVRHHGARAVVSDGRDVTGFGQTCQLELLVSLHFNENVGATP